MASKIHPLARYPRPVSLPRVRPRLGDACSLKGFRRPLFVLLISCCSRIRENATRQGEEGANAENGHISLWDLIFVSRSLSHLQMLCIVTDRCTASAIRRSATTLDTTSGSAHEHCEIQPAIGRTQRIQAWSSASLNNVLTLLRCFAFLATGTLSTVAKHSTRSSRSTISPHCVFKIVRIDTVKTQRITLRTKRRRSPTIRARTRPFAGSKAYPPERNVSFIMVSGNVRDKVGPNCARNIDDAAEQRLPTQLAVR